MRLSSVNMKRQYFALTCSNPHVNICATAIYHHHHHPNFCKLPENQLITADISKIIYYLKYCVPVFFLIGKMAGIFYV